METHASAMPVRRQARLDVDRAAVCQCLLASAGQIQPPQFQCAAVVAREHHAATVARDIGLIVISADGMSEFGSVFTVDALAPERACPYCRLTIDCRAGSSPRKARGQLRQVQLAPVVAMRQIDLLEHRFAPACRRQRRAAAARTRATTTSSAGVVHAERPARHLAQTHAQQRDCFIYFCSTQAQAAA